MDEILQKLLQSELLSEETKSELSEQWTVSVEAFKMKIREETSLEVRAELAEQWVSQRDELVAKVDGFVSEALVNEMAELRGDIERFRDLDVEFAEKLVEEKHRLAAEVSSELDQLAEKLDVFLEAQLTAEFAELKEDLEIVKQNTFGRDIYEAFASVYAKAHVDESSVTGKLKIAEAKLRDAKRALVASENSRETMIRESKLNTLLASLSGQKREAMEMVLKNVETDRLDESYKFFIGRVLKGNADALNEDTANKKTTVVTGNAPASDVAKQPAALSESLLQLQRLAGIK